MTDREYVEKITIETFCNKCNGCKTDKKDIFKGPEICLLANIYLNGVITGLGLKDEYEKNKIS